MERDVRNFQTGVPKALNKCHEFTRANFPGETQITALSAWLPAMNCLGDLYHASLDDLHGKKISRFFIRDSMLSVDTLGVSECVIVKELLNTFKELCTLDEIGLDRWISSPLKT